MEIPNDGQHSPQYKSRGHGMSTGHLWYSMRFGNDAYDLWVSTQYSDEEKEKYFFVMAAEDFRNLALWYLYRWAVGEWFGLKRWLFYVDLAQRMKRLKGF